MLIDVFLPAEKGLDIFESDPISQDENHNDPHLESHAHRHAECLKPYDPKTARKSVGRGPAFKTSVTSLSKVKVSSQSSNDEAMNSQESNANRYATGGAVDSDDFMEDVLIPPVEGGISATNPNPTGNATASRSNNTNSNSNNRGNNNRSSNANTSMANGIGPASSSESKRQNSSLVKPTKGSNQAWKNGRGADLTPAEPKNISKDVPAKTWKSIRFASTCSRGSNTTAFVNVTKSVQTISTAYKLRLNRWPVWSTSIEYYRRNPAMSIEEDFHFPLWARRILSFIFSQFGIVLFLISWITGHAALFQHLEQKPDIKMFNDVILSRNELVINLATELRQVFPYEMAWRRKIDDYFIKFEATLNNATIRGYSTHRRTFYKWDYLDFVLFSFQLITGQGTNNNPFTMDSLSSLFNVRVTFALRKPQLSRVNRCGTASDGTKYNV